MYHVLPWQRRALRQVVSAGGFLQGLDMACEGEHELRAVDYPQQMVVGVGHVDRPVGGSF